MYSYTNLTTIEEEDDAADDEDDDREPHETSEEPTPTTGQASSPVVREVPPQHETSSSVGQTEAGTDVRGGVGTAFLRGSPRLPSPVDDGHKDEFDQFKGHFQTQRGRSYLTQVNPR